MLTCRHPEETNSSPPGAPQQPDAWHYLAPGVRSEREQAQRIYIRCENCGPQAQRERWA